LYGFAGTPRDQSKLADSGPLENNELKILNAMMAGAKKRLKAGLDVDPDAIGDLMADCYLAMRERVSKLPKGHEAKSLQEILHNFSTMVEALPSSGEDTPGRHGDSRSESSKGRST
jgi:hypothetical protein